MCFCSQARLEDKLSYVYVTKFFSVSNNAPDEANANENQSHSGQNIVSISNETKYPETCKDTRDGGVQWPILGEVHLLDIRGTLKCE